MVGLAAPSVNLLYIVLLLVPGVIGIDLYLRASKRIGDLSRLKVLVYSVALSILSILLLYIGSPVLYPFVTGFSSDFTSIWSLSTSTDLLNLEVSDWFFVYISQTLLAVSLGFIIGKIDLNLYGDGSRDRRDAWKFAFGKAPREGEELIVVTNDGTRLKGLWNEKAFTKSKRELYLDEPSKISNNGEEETQLGRGIYLHENEIAQVVIPELDPDSRKYDDYRKQQDDDGEASEEAEEAIDNLMEDGSENTDK